MSRQLTTLVASAAVFALSIATPRLCLAQSPPDYSGTVQADFRMDASGGFSLSGVSASLTFGSLTLPVSCTGDIGPALWYTSPFNWSWGNGLTVSYNLVERVFDLGGSLVEYDTRTESVGYFYEDFINTGPTERSVDLPTPFNFLHGFVQVSPSVLIKYQVTIDGGRQVFLDQDATVETLTIGTSSALTYPDGSYSLVVRNQIDNAGSFRKVGNTDIVFSVPFNNTGTVEVQSGTLALSGGGASTGRFDVASGAMLKFTGGTQVLDPGARFTGAGVTRLDGGWVTARGIGTSIEGNVEVNYGDFTVEGAVDVPGRFSLIGGWYGALAGPGELRVTGTLDWTGGTMRDAGSVSLGSGGIMHIGGDAVKTLNGRTINNAGTATWTGAGNLEGQNGGVINNLAGAVFEIQNDAAFLRTYIPGDGWSAQAAPIFNNAGLLRKTGGIGTTSFNNEVVFNNNGTVEVQSGTLAFQGGYTQTDGATMLTGGTLTSATPLDIQCGDVGGSGSLIADVFNTGGRVSPGMSVGYLIVDGDYMQGAAASLLIQLSGTAAGDFDVLDITGRASLGGTLDIDLIEGFQPSFGDTFTFITFGSRSGEFATVNGLDLGNGLRFDLTYGSQDLTLTTTPEPATLTLLALGSLTLLNGSRRRHQTSK